MVDDALKDDIVDRKDDGRYPSVKVKSEVEIEIEVTRSYDTQSRTISNELSRSYWRENGIQKILTNR